jgi:E3 ubiquitin-protein ligase UHRF1
MPDGLWSGERFGAISGVPVGTVFGAGDYQRLGRQQMMLSGFFRPFVTPEWCAPGAGCYSLILNNDNGASDDRGDVIMYAGSGGRMRGQNRTAPQSFNQDWHNVTNAALRLNLQNGKPVRVVRGPKLQGGFGTADCGGGYRYDGLYRVAAASMQRLRGSKFVTAMFELRKL